MPNIDSHAKTATPAPSSNSTERPPTINIVVITPEAWRTAVRMFLAIMQHSASNVDIMAHTLFLVEAVIRGNQPVQDLIDYIQTAHQMSDPPPELADELNRGVVIIRGLHQEEQVIARCRDVVNQPGYT
jgi:hypothetical protein